MRATALLTPNRGGKHRPHKPRHPKAFIATDSGLKLVLPYAPNEVEHNGLADDWETVDRPGRKPLVTFTAEGLRAMSFTALLGHPDHQDDVEDKLKHLKKIAGSSSRITVSLSALERGAWRLTSCTVRTQLRQYGTNAVTRATVDLAFVEATGAVRHTGPLTGGHKKPARHDKHRTPGARGGASASFYVVKPGDSLARIAGKQLGDPDRWLELGALNGIVNPKTDLTPGRVLTIPAG